MLKVFKFLYLISKKGRVLANLWSFLNYHTAHLVILSVDPTVRLESSRYRKHLVLTQIRMPSSLRTMVLQNKLRVLQCSNWDTSRNFAAACSEKPFCITWFYQLHLADVTYNTCIIDLVLAIVNELNITTLETGFERIIQAICLDHAACGHWSETVTCADWKAAETIETSI